MLNIIYSANERYIIRNITSVVNNKDSESKQLQTYLYVGPTICSSIVNWALGG